MPSDRPRCVARELEGRNDRSKSDIVLSSLATDTEMLRARR
jgi:hypothetical protein